MNGRMAMLGPGRLYEVLPAPPGLPSHQPSRTLNSASNSVTSGDEWYPMFGLAAAPDIESAVPIVMPRAYVWDGLKPRLSAALPQCNGDAVNGTALRSCQASRFELTTLSAIFTTWNGCHVSLAGVQSEVISLLSASSNPVKGLGARFGFDAPRYARIRRLRYREWI